MVTLLKKVVFVLVLIAFFCTGCGLVDLFVTKDTSESDVITAQERTAKYLMDTYIDGYMNKNPETIKSIYPKFVYESSPENFTQDKMNESYQRSADEFGEDFKITYEIKEEKKLTTEELDELNAKIKKYYKTEETVSDCYYLDGTMTFSGSKFTDPDPIAAYRCKYNGEWILVG